MKRHDLSAAGKLGRDESENGRLDPDIVEVDGGNPELVTEKKQEVVRLKRPHSYQVVTKPAAAAFLFLESLLQIIRADDPRVHKDVAYFFSLPVGKVRFPLYHTTRFLPCSFAL